MRLERLGFPKLVTTTSSEVHTDGSVTFRFHAPNVKEVKLALEGTAPILMKKDDQGFWNVTTSPLSPDYYGYMFLADNVAFLDPSNHVVRPNLLQVESEEHVVGPSSLSWEINDVPHGDLNRHFYRSVTFGDSRDFYVYTPPCYDSRAKRRYPVLYLLHGYSDDASAWSAVGRANIILDNLIAQGKAKNMIVVMPLSYGNMDFVLGGDVWNSTERRQRNFSQFRQTLLVEIMPQVEKTYRVIKNRNFRAVAGLSMGGSESLLIGLNDLDKFGWIGAFSSAGLSDDFQADFPLLDWKANGQLRLLWIACGTGDHLITLNRNLRSWLTARGVNLTDIETPGSHNWIVWRRNLTEFVPLLFQSGYSLTRAFQSH
jgi:enterochelin esterase-like enzyme